MEDFWTCGYCGAKTKEGVVTCPNCRKEHEIDHFETRIELGDVTYSRRLIGLGPTGIELVVAGHIGQRAISCGHLPEKLREEIREYVMMVELAHMTTEQEVERRGG